MEANGTKRARFSDAISRFQDYLRINTMQPNPDYETASAFLEQQAADIGLSCQRWMGVPGKPVIIMTLEGEDTTLPSLCLNSHVDVVPVDLEHWIHPPFAANKVDGKIYARGSQDMKCVGMQYLEAIRVLRSQGKKLKRTIHLTYVPDEEIGGHDGMEKFVKDPLFKKLNIGCALDEGLANETEKFTAFYGERVPWWVTVVCEGPPGHGSRFVKNTATVKMNTVINRFLEFRKQQEEALEKDSSKKLGDVTSVNLTIVRAGVQCNVIPSKAECSFDIRIPPTVDLKAFQQQLDEWTREEGISYRFEQVYFTNPMTDISDKNPFWTVFKKACESCTIEVEPEIFPAATDSRYLRCVGIPAIGFSPMNQTPVLLHDHNEYLHEDIYTRGIEIYCEIISALANA